MKKVSIVLYFLIGIGYFMLRAQNQGEMTMQNQGKLKAIRALRNRYAWDVTVKNNAWKLLTSEIDSLRSEGSFHDIRDAHLIKGDTVLNDSLLTEAFVRIWNISEALRDNRWTLEYNQETWERCQKAILRYGAIEINRSIPSAQYSVSYCEIPTAAVNIYFCQLRLMEKAEQDSLASQQLKATCEMLKTLALRAWTPPDRKDWTQSYLNIPINAIALERPLWQVAIMHCSIEMMDRLAETYRKLFETMSQTIGTDTLKEEGYTADGLCWALGRQAWTGERKVETTTKVLESLKCFKDTPWGGIDRNIASVLVNYFRGSSFYYYKGYKVPCLGQNTMLYHPKQELIAYESLLKYLIVNWESLFNKVDFKELKQLYIEAQGYDPTMYRNPYYTGTRWFFNNDDLIKKNRNYHIAVNMASSRSDSPGSELVADAYNHFSADGATFFQKTGTEYQKILGGYDITAFPGVTAREGMKYIAPAIGKPGYCSKHNFAAGATSGGENAVAGFKYEKISVTERGKEEKRNYNQPEEVVLYGVKAHKSYFILGDYFVALGAGITNKVPCVRRRIRTTIEQTEQMDSIYLYKGNGIDWVIHKNRFAYSVFPQYKDNAYHVCETKKTSWGKMNPHNGQIDGLPEKVDVFRMWIDHGHHPMNDTYGYVVYAGVGSPPANYPFEILRNDTLIQAVKSTDSHVVGAIFYNAEEELSAKGISISVSSPCAVLIEKSNGYLTLSVTDALMDQNCRQIAVTFNKRKITLNMPQGKLCGQSSVYRRCLSDL